MPKYLIVGAGLTGCVIARQLAENGSNDILVIDKRDHIGGNCYDYIDSETGILMNKYGAHIFHTNSEIVWDYVNKFAKWYRWDHKVKVFIKDINRYLPIPVNQETINVLCNTSLQNPCDTQDWLNNITIPVSSDISPEQITSEDVCLARVGSKLYECIFKPYTIKQWNKQPCELSGEICARIPIKYDNDTRYFTDKYQGLPIGGYTKFIDNMMNHSSIHINLNTDFHSPEFAKNNNLDEYIIIYTGPVDNYFKSAGFPSLEYRSINFIIERPESAFFQPESVVNYPSLDYPYTRIVEYKHFPDNIHLSTLPRTLIVKEVSTDAGEPYYPVLSDKNKELYNQYKALADNLFPRIHFIGRLANYKYFNMDQAIANALEYYNKYICSD